MCEEISLDGIDKNHSKWTLSFGIHSPKVGVGRFRRRGLFATATISLDELVVMVPSSAGIYSSKAEKTFGSRAVRWNDAERLIVLLLFEMVNPHSAFRNYIKILPTLNQIDPPILWPDRLKNIANGSAAFAYLNHISSAMIESKSNICSSMTADGPAVDPTLQFVACDEDLLLWAYSVVRTRSFQGSDGLGAMLLPFLDLANHSPLAPQLHLPSSDGTGAAGLVSNSHICTGQEIFVQYDQSSNANLFANYGFVLPRNPHDSVVILGHLPTARDDFSRNRIKFLKTEGLLDLRRNPRVIAFGGRPSPALMKYLRLSCLRPREWVRHAKRVVAGKDAPHRAEVCAWRLLRARAAQLLLGFSMRPTAAAALMWLLENLSKSKDFDRRRLKAVLHLVTGEQELLLLARNFATQKIMGLVGPQNIPA